MPSNSKGRALEVAREWMRTRSKTIPPLEDANSFITARLADLLLTFSAEREREAIVQCAIEAGERSPEGVSSHTMLGDMWDARIEKLRESAQPAKGRG